MINFFRAPLALAMAVGVMSASQATNYVSVEGSGVTFFYDADYWGLNSASVAGNSISFSVDPAYSLAAKVAANKPNGTSTQTYAEGANAAVVAVAHTGSLLSSVVGFNLLGNYVGVNGGSSVNASASGDLYTGTFAGGAFSSGAYATSYSVGFSNDASSPTAGNINLGHAGFDNGSKYRVLGVDTLLYSNVYQQSPGSLSLSVTTARYDFAVSAVPEPATYALLLAGMGVLAGVACRKRQA